MFQKIRSDLTDILWPDAERIYFTDGSSSSQDEAKYSEAVVAYCSAARNVSTES